MALPAIDLPRVNTGRFAFGVSQQEGRPAPEHWEPWLQTLFPSHVGAGFADHHRAFWEHVDSIRKDVRPRPFVAIWPRGGGKSTGCELATVYLTARRRRRYVWYVRETQDQADASVENIGALLESAQMETYYPPMARRKLGKYGNSRGWRRSRLRTEWATIDALGLDKAARGSRVEEDRPDLIIFDDVDGKHDSLETTAKKEQTLTTSLLPAGSTDVAVIFVQNLIHPASIASRLAGVNNQRADYLGDRIVSGPHPAVVGLDYAAEEQPDGTMRYRITAGTPTWAGQDLATCEEQLTTWGPSAFLIEAQQAVDDNPAALWSRELLKQTRILTPPDCHSIVVAVDPPASTGQAGVIVVGVARIAGQLHGYVLEDASPPAGVGPAAWGAAAVNAYHRHRASAIVAEVNNGGDMIENVIRNVERGRNVPYRTVRATRGKYTRAEPVATVFRQGRGHLVGHYADLENQLCSWVPGDPSPDRLDAMVWGFTDLALTPAGEMPKGQPTHDSRWQREPAGNWRRY